MLLTYLLLPSLLQSERGRVVNVSSAIHKTGVMNLANMHLRSDWTSHRAYSSSKLLEVGGEGGGGVLNGWSGELYLSRVPIRSCSPARWRSG